MCNDDKIIIEVKSKPILPNSKELENMENLIKQQASWRFELVITNSKNNEGTVSKHKGKRVKTELQIFATQTIDDLFERFYQAKVAEGRATRTLHQYTENFRYFTYFLGYKGFSRKIDTITTDVIHNYLVFMKNEKTQFEDHNYKPDDYKTVGISPSTINTRLKTLRVMFRFLVDEELIERNPMKQIKNVNEPQEEIAVLTVDELRRLLDA
ncbi:phage integrase N-terminal SAM-like domain-containing protein [Bacillus cereus]|uniref:phage integrase SAM-like domain-containing protein n=1 Tax=Bacillus cereus TaxID=1396 RepID=UPI001E2E52B0|nr:MULTISPECIES: phage integrase SAM-like domain-containing protein [Bacillus cereus group]MDZ4631675.1 phage integrase N-terminal SAM-like domain-containing protein [Bacillus cereus]